MTAMTFAGTRRNQFFSRIREWSRDALAAYRKAKLIRETEAELRGLTDRELEDIGLSRYGIKAAARAAALDSPR